MVGGSGDDVEIIVIGGIHCRGDSKLLDVGDAGRAFGSGFGLGKDGEKDCGEQGDDGDDDQKFD